MESVPKRICVYTHVTDIDGHPQRRHTKIGEDFCQTVLGRPFNSTLNPSNYDHIHIPGDFDSSEPLKRWFILDLDVIQRLSKEQVLQLAHEVYVASKQNGEL